MVQGRQRLSGCLKQAKGTKGSQRVPKGTKGYKRVPSDPRYARGFYWSKLGNEFLVLTKKYLAVEGMQRFDQGVSPAGQRQSRARAKRVFCSC